MRSQRSDGEKSIWQTDEPRLLSSLPLVAVETIALSPILRCDFPPAASTNDIAGQIPGSKKPMKTSSCFQGLCLAHIQHSSDSGPGVLHHALHDQTRRLDCANGTDAGACRQAHFLMVALVWAVGSTALLAGIR